MTPLDALDILLIVEVTAWIGGIVAMVIYRRRQAKEGTPFRKLAVSAGFDASDRGLRAMIEDADSDCGENG